SGSQTPLDAEHLQTNVAAAISPMPPSSSGILSSSSLISSTLLSPSPRQSAIKKYFQDQFASILGYGDLIQGNVTIKRVYYVEGLNHNLFSVGQFCDADLEVAFRKSTCFVRDL
ncbi:hypothetical protein Tco_1535356, partial [Tanacetum coccineum]